MTVLGNTNELAAPMFRRPSGNTTILRHYATGNEDVDVRYAPGKSFRLVFVRMHFVNSTGVYADMILSLESAAGDEYNTSLYRYEQRGVNRDVNLIFTAAEIQHPSGWSFAKGDQIHVAWANPMPKDITWGLEIGVAIP